MAFQDKLKRASFRGIDFLTKDFSFNGGRRIKVHEYPYSDDSYTEDSGIITKTFSIKAFFLGENALDQRDLLTDALDKEGPGILIHPSKGEFEAIGTYSVEENFVTDSRLVSLSINFTKYGDQTFPEVKKNIPGAFDNLITEIDSDMELASDGFYELFSSNLQIVLAVGSFFSSVIEGLEDLVTGYSRLLDDISREINFIKFNRDWLINTPSRLSKLINKSNKRLKNAIENFDTPKAETLAAIQKRKRLFRISLAIKDRLDRSEEVKASNKITGIQNSFFQIYSIISNYEILDSSGGIEDLIEFSDTLDELIESMDLIEESLLELQVKYEQNFTDLDSNIIYSIYKNSKILKTVLIDYKEEKTKNLSIKTVDVDGISLIDLSYKFFKDEIGIEEILKYNNIINPSSVRGKIKIVLQ